MSNVILVFLVSRPVRPPPRDVPLRLREVVLQLVRQRGDLRRPPGRDRAWPGGHTPEVHQGGGPGLRGQGEDWGSRTRGQRSGEHQETAGSREDRRPRLHLPTVQQIAGHSSATKIAWRIDHFSSCANFDFTDFSTMSISSPHSVTDYSTCMFCSANLFTSLSSNYEWMRKLNTDSITGSGQTQNFTSINKTVMRRCVFKLVQMNWQRLQKNLLKSIIQRCL